MGLLLRSTSYTPEIFQSVPHFQDQVPKLDILKLPKIMEDVGRIFVKHGAHKQFSLIVVHRHFELGDDEILVDFEPMDGSISVALPWKFNPKLNLISGPTCLDDLKSFGMNKKGLTSVAGMTWTFDAKGEIHPFEFQASREDGDDFKVPPPAFVTELFATLRRLGVDKMFGLRRSCAKFWETTDNAKRANIAHFGKTPIPPELVDSMKVIYWSFNDNGAYSEDGACAACTCCAHTPEGLVMRANK